MSEESKSWYLMSRPLFNSGFEDDEFWAYGQDGFQEILDSCIGSDVLIFDKKLSAEPQPVRAIVQNVTSDVYNSTLVRQILCNIGILKCGQYIKIGDAYWLVSALPDNNRIYEKAVLWKCKYTLRFLSPLTGEVVEYPVHDINSTQYGTGETEKEHITIGDSQHLVYIPYNDETIKIENRFRFLMDRNTENPTAYRVTQVDTTSYSVGSESDDGLIQWSVLETPFNEAVDSAEEMIADFYKDTLNDDAEDTAGTSITLTDADGDYRIAIGEQKVIEVSCVREDGSVVNPSECVVSLVPDDGSVSFSIDGNHILLKAAHDRHNVGKTVALFVSNEELQDSASIDIQIVNW